MTNKTGLLLQQAIKIYVGIHDSLAWFELSFLVKKKENGRQRSSPPIWLGLAQQPTLSGWPC